MSRVMHRTGLLGIVNGGYTTVLTVPSGHKYEVIQFNAATFGTAGTRLLASLTTPSGTITVLDRTQIGATTAIDVPWSSLAMNAGDSMAVAFQGLGAAFSFGYITYIDVTL